MNRRKLSQVLVLALAFSLTVPFTPVLGSAVQANGNSDTRTENSAGINETLPNNSTASGDPATVDAASGNSPAVTNEASSDPYNSPNATEAPSSSGAAGAPASLDEQLTLVTNSSQMLFNGRTVMANQPMTLVKGRNYLPLSSVAPLFGYTVRYDKRTREAVASKGDQEVRIGLNSSTMTVNGSRVSTTGTTYTQNGYLMLPIRAWLDLTGSRLTRDGESITISWQVQLSAAFTVAPPVIYASQTRVQYTNQAVNDPNVQIVQDVWEGNLEVFPAAGTYTVSRRIQDARGRWSAPYEVQVEVRPANEPPVAVFVLDKEIYRMGEPILYTDLSRDDEDQIIRRTWTGKEPAFFEPGTYTVELEVEDVHGLTHMVSQQLVVTEEQLYTQNEFNLLFTPIGEKFELDSSKALRMASVPFTINPDNNHIIRSNSPELLLEEGIAYQDTLSGEVRFNIHNSNGSDKRLQVYLLATNPNRGAVTLTKGARGIAGPAAYVTTSGKTAVSRYLESLHRQESEQVVLAPGQTVQLLPISASPLRPGQTLTSYADFSADYQIQYTIVALDPEKDVMLEWNNLSLLPRDNKHARGRFQGGGRTLGIMESVGYTEQRLELGQKQVDPHITGTDMTLGTTEVNDGNRGVLYRMQLRVAPRTTVAINPRGGHYGGAFLVNGKVVQTTGNSILRNPSEAGVIHRTGEQEELVDIVFVVVSGSNMPINMLFFPMPEIKL